MSRANRIFLMVLDSFGIGEMPDAADFKDEGSNTLAACVKSEYFDMPNLKRLGLFNIEGVDCAPPAKRFDATIARMTEKSKGKDTTIGHWEIAGIISEKPLPTYPGGFPQEVMDEFERQTGCGWLVNRPYSGTEVISDYGEEHIRTGKLIVYTSADSVFQIAAHEDVVPVEKLYEYCKIARGILKGEHGVGRVIARPFAGEPGSFMRTTNRHDFSLEPPKATMLDVLRENGRDVIGVGKINDIFAGKGITEFLRTSGNADGIEKTLDYMKKDFNGLCFVNLVDFDMLYGHRNDVDGYAKALAYFDKKVPELITHMREGDVIMLTADHGCDPSTPSTDHSREYTPFIMFGPHIKYGVNLGTRESFADIAATVLELLGIGERLEGESML